MLPFPSLVFRISVILLSVRLNDTPGILALFLIKLSVFISVIFLLDTSLIENPGEYHERLFLLYVRKWAQSMQKLDVKWSENDVWM